MYKWSEKILYHLKQYNIAKCHFNINITLTKFSCYNNNHNPSHYAFLGSIASAFLIIVRTFSDAFMTSSNNPCNVILPILVSTFISTPKSFCSFCSSFFYKRMTINALKTKRPIGIFANLCNIFLKKSFPPASFLNFCV